MGCIGITKFVHHLVSSRKDSIIATLGRRDGSVSWVDFVNARVEQVLSVVLQGYKCIKPIQRVTNAKTE